jgi:hypothetical protein
MKLKAKRDELRRLYDLADRKGYDVTQSTMRLEALPDRTR